MTEKVLYQATLIFPIRDQEVLLAFKTAKIGKDCWNGYGGGVEEGEQVEVGAVRELEEESGLVTSADNLFHRGLVNFHNQTETGEKFICQVYIFSVPIEKCWGELIETNTMITPTWFKKNNLPKMMPADRFWLPSVLEGRRIIAEAHYGPNQRELLQPVKVKVL